MKRSASAALCLSLATSIGQAADAPQWLAEAMARESRPITPREIRSVDNWLIATVPAKAIGTIEKIDESYSIELSHGKGVSIHCEVVPDGIDLADMVRVSAQTTLKRAADVQGTIETRQVEAVDAGVIDSSPYLAISWVYTVKSVKGPLVGALRQISVNKDGVGIYCAHANLGYTKTFETITRALVTSLKTADARRPPYYQEVSTLSIGNLKSGVLLTTLVRDADGDTVATQKMSILLPNAADVSSQDSVNIEWIDSDAAMINAVHIVARDGELTTHLKLNPDHGDWLVQGDIQGKNISAKLDEGSQPGTWVAQAWQLRKLLAAPEAIGREHDIPMWASANPGKLTNGKTRVLAKLDDEHYNVLTTIGTVQAAVTLDALSGLPTTAEIQMGAQKMRFERIYVSGAF